MRPGAASARRPAHLLVAAIDGERVHWSEERRGQTRNIVTTRLGGDIEPQPRARIEAVYRSGRVPLCLRLPAGACLERSLELPLAAQRDFARILRLDMERATPFRSADIRSAFLVESAERGAAQGKVPVRQFIVKRSIIDVWRDDIEAQGFTVALADCRDDTTGRAHALDFLAADEDAGRGPKSTFGRAVLVLLAGLAVSAYVLGLDRAEKATEALDGKIAAARLKVEADRRQNDAATAVASAHASLLALHAGTAAGVRVITELTSLLPDGSALTELVFARDKVSIAGFSDNAAPLLATLEASEVFEAVDMTAPITRDPQSGKEQFRIEARLSAARTSQATPRQTSRRERGL